MEKWEKAHLGRVRKTTVFHCKYLPSFIFYVNPSEDRRLKKFVGFQEPELSEDDIAAMTARVSGAPLPRAIEYLSSLPDYYPEPIDGLLDMKFKPGMINLRQFVLKMKSHDEVI